MKSSIDSFTDFISEEFDTPEDIGQLFAKPIKFVQPLFKVRMYESMQKLNVNEGLKLDVVNYANAHTNRKLIMEKSKKDFIVRKIGVRYMIIVRIK